MQLSGVERPNGAARLNGLSSLGLPKASQHKIYASLLTYGPSRPRTSSAEEPDRPLNIGFCSAAALQNIHVKGLSPTAPAFE